MSVQEGVDPAGLVDDLAEAAVGVGDRVEHRVDPVGVSVVIVVGEREEQEVVEVLPHQLAAHAGGVGVAGSRTREGRLAGDPAAGIQLTVEELVGPPDRVAELGGHRHPAHQSLEAELVAPASAKDQKRRHRRPHPGVAQALEHGFHLVREVGHVHVVDGVVEGPEETEGAGRFQGGAVLDVAVLGAVVPVHAADAVPVRSGRPWRSPSRRRASPRERTRRSRRSASRARAGRRSSAPGRRPPPAAACRCEANRRR